MQKHYVLKLVPKTPFHTGDLMDMETTDVILHSDTIFSALCNVSDKFFGKANYSKFIKPFVDDKPPFLLSSAFPYYEHPEGTLYFFPKPQIFKSFVDKHPKNAKKFKKISFVSEAIFNAYLNGNDDFLETQFQDVSGNVVQENLVQGNTLWLSKEEQKLLDGFEQLWKTQREPRIILNRKTQETGIYHYSRVYYRKNAGLFVLITIQNKLEEKLLLQDIIKKFRFLGDSGIGGERSLGNGQFELKAEFDNQSSQLTFKESPNNAKTFVTLSLLLPKKDEIEKGLLGDLSYYLLINRKGWISDSTYLRKSINMITEGSVMYKPNSEIIGKMVNLTPDILKNKNPSYEIHRYGYGYSVNIEIKG